ncbi:MAG: hypothetical protein K2X36_02630 [Microbacteriaceae bacterium]|nr:hypothetical protein [Microbacteriaceae bacterium]
MNASDAQRAEWARAAAQRGADQAQARAKKERILGEVRRVVNKEPTWDNTQELQKLGREFFAAGYAGKPANDELKAKYDSLRDEYTRRQEAHRRALKDKQDRVRREMERLLFQLERVAHADTHPRRYEAWKELASKFFDAGYPGKEAKAELMMRYERYKSELPRGYERDRKHRATTRRW